MKGRLENSFKRKAEIKQILEDVPVSVTDYYYKLQTYAEPSTCVTYLRRIRHFLSYTDKEPSKITDTDIGKYFENISFKENDEGEKEATSQAYKQLTWTVLNQFFDYCVQTNAIQRNPMLLVKRSRKVDKIDRVPLSVEDLNKILQAAEDGAGNSLAKARQANWRERDILILYLFMHTGIRKTAVTEINVDDIIMDEHRLIVTDKGNKTQDYFLTPELEEALVIWLRKRDALLKGKKCDALFISKNLIRMGERAVYNLVKKYSQEALGYAISPHKLRGAFVTLYYEASGHDIDATREAVGHCDIATTSRYIVQKNDNRMEAAKFMSSHLAKI